MSFSLPNTTPAESVKAPMSESEARRLADHRRLSDLTNRPGNGGRPRQAGGAEESQQGPSAPSRVTSAEPSLPESPYPEAAGALRPDDLWF